MTDGERKPILAERDPFSEAVSEETEAKDPGRPWMCAACRCPSHYVNIVNAICLPMTLPCVDFLASGLFDAQREA